jgi:N-acyl-D-aspartate/D-glutamate deacylase
MHDLVIRNGTVVDGTGAPRRRADVAIDGDRIVAVGVDVGGARRELDAGGLVVTPGWVDLHTHYDGQVTWDSMLAPSSTNGVTSIVMGNCGVGFAPAHTDKHEWLISLLEGVEDIPGTALAEGLPWNWESFTDYLDALDARPYTLDVGTQVPHAALRTYVMGDRGGDHTAVASDDDIAAMAQLCEEGVRAGALGFTTSRTYVHRTRAGESIGTLTAATDEVLGVASALQRAGHGVVQLISDAYQSSDDELVARELELLRRLALELRRPLSFTVQQNDDTPDRFRELLDAVARWNGEGARARTQVAVRPIGVLIGLTASVQPFAFCPSWREVALLPRGEQVVKLRAAELRRRLLDEHAASHPQGFVGIIHSGYSRMYPLTDPAGYEPTPADSIEGIASASGRPANEVLYDTLFEGDGNTLLYIPLFNYARGNLDDVYEMITSPHSLFGLSDAGAHCNTICDGSYPTTAIAHWTRDRTRGPRVPLEQMVHCQTQRTAAHVGWLDRGVLAPGYLADVNLIDAERIALHPPQLVRDLPAGGSRLLQQPVGYRATVKRGAVTFVDGEHTGELPGRLVRGPREL